jgi:hypothetical protein
MDVFGVCRRPNKAIAAPKCTALSNRTALNRVAIEIDIGALLFS